MASRKRRAAPHSVLQYSYKKHRAASNDTADHKNGLGAGRLNQHFRLLDLPTEVRLEIYRACLTRPFNILLSKSATPTYGPNDIVDLYDRPRRRSPRLRVRSREHTFEHAATGLENNALCPRESMPQDKDPLLVNLLRTSQLIYREARPILYGENVFDIKLDTARPTLAALHQRSRGLIHSIRLELPPGNDALERFAELVRLSLRYCWRLRTFRINMSYHIDSSSHANIYANAFDNLRWLQKNCKVLLEGEVDPDIKKVVQLKTALAESLDETAYARRQLMSSDKSFLLFAAATHPLQPQQ